MAHVLEALNARCEGLKDAEAIEMREGVFTAFLPTAVAFGAAGEFERQTMDEIRTAISLQREASGEGILGLNIEAGSGFIKLLAKLWQEDARGFHGETIADVKLQLGRRTADATLAATLNDLITFFCDGLGLKAIQPENFNIGKPHDLFADFAEPRDFACIYGTQSLRDLARTLGRDVLPRIRILSGDEEGQIVFAAIIPEADHKRPGTVAVEIGSGSTEIVCVADDGDLLPLTVAIGARTTEPPLKALEGFLRTGDARPDLQDLLESPPDTVTAFFGRKPSPVTDLFVNPSRASVTYRGFAHARSTISGDDGIQLDQDMVEAYNQIHGQDGFAPKAGILLTVANGLGLHSFREGRKGGLKEGIAVLLAEGLTALAHPG